MHWRQRGLWNAFEGDRLSQEQGVVVGRPQQQPGPGRLLLVAALVLHGVAGEGDGDGPVGAPGVVWRLDAELHGERRRQPLGNLLLQVRPKLRVETAAKEQ